MTSLIVLYGVPDDEQAFRSYYRDTHLPLALNLPGLRIAEHALGLTGADGKPADTFGFFRADFDDDDALGYALNSPAGQRVAADVPNYASGGAVVMVGEVHHSSARAVATRAYLDAWNRHDVDGILLAFAESGVYTDPATSGEIGGEQLRAHLTGLFDALPDLTLHLLTVQAEGDHGVAFWRGEAAGGAVTFLGSDLLRFDDDTRIVWTAALYDAQDFAAQIAALSTT